MEMPLAGAAESTVSTYVVATAVMVMEPLPVALLYVEELPASGVYDAVNVLLPAGNEPAATLMVAFPEASTVAAEAYVPLERVTEPVGVGLPLPPLTLTETLKACAVVTVGAEGVTVTVGASKTGAVTVTPADPEALLYVEELPESGV